MTPKEHIGKKRIVVAIDGPAGAGKSTLARRVAGKLGYLYINTGAMFRAVALWALRLKVATGDMHRLEQLAEAANIELTEAGLVVLNGEDITEAIREPHVAEAASRISAVPGVRRALLLLQRKMAETTSVVMEGRDIGTVVFPEAQVKVFLDADPGERARRRALEMVQEGQDTSIDEVEDDLRLRDERDRMRKEAPLMQAPDAQLVDTTGLTLEQVEDVILRLVRARTSNGKSVTS